MDLLDAKDVVSVILFDLRMSESEAQYLADSLRYILESLSDEQIHFLYNNEFARNVESPNDTRFFVERMYKELMNLIKEHCQEEFLQRRFKEWKIESPDSDPN